MQKKIEGGRALLNLPGHHTTAAIVAEIETRGPGRYDVDANVAISDCDRKISLEFYPNDPDYHENDLYKIDTLQKFRRALVKAQKRAAA